MTDRPTPPAPPTPRGVSRRTFIHAGAASAAASGLSLAAEAEAATASVAADARPTITITLTLNGSRRTLSVAPNTTLVEALRDVAGLTGTKIGCNHGQCGACTVVMDGRRVNSCLALALQADGAEVVTIEGLSDPAGELHPMQAAFAEHDAFQCGYCTSGQILSAICCIEEGHAGSEAEIREYMSGNLCRCGAYTNIVSAVVPVRDGRG